MITTTASVQEVYMVVSTSKARTKHTASYTIHRKRQTRTHDYDRNDDDGSGVDRGASSCRGKASSQKTCSPKRSCC